MFPPPNIGSLSRPVREGTPVQFIASIVGIILGGLVYGAGLNALFVARARRVRAIAGVDDAR
jgi:hypothetical protein